MHWNKISLRAAIPRFSVCLILLGLGLRNGGSMVTTYVVVAALALDGLILGLERVSENRIWSRVVETATSLEVMNIAFGYGMVGLAQQLLNQSMILPGLLLLAAGALFLGVGVGQLLGKGGRIIIQEDARVAVWLGAVTVVGSLVWLVIGLISPVAGTGMHLVNSVMPQIVLTAYGIMLIVFGIKTARRRQAQNPNNLWKSGKVVGLTDRPYVTHGESVTFDEVLVKGDLSGDLEYNGKRLRIVRANEIIGLLFDAAGARGPVWRGVECTVLD